MQQTTTITNNYRNTWINFINSTGIFEYFLTITFDYGTSRQTCYKSTNLLLHRINQRIFGRRYKKNNQFITGFSFTELQKSGQPHFHIIINTDHQYALKNKPSFELHLTRQLYKFGYNYFSLAQKKHNSLLINNVVLKPVYSQKNLISYCTKTMHLNCNSSFISPLSTNGMLYI